MEKKNYLILDDEFIQYCRLNNIEDVQKLAKETFNRGFTILKYGNIPSDIITHKKIENTNNVVTPKNDKNSADDLYDT